MVELVGPKTNPPLVSTSEIPTDSKSLRNHPLDRRIVIASCVVGATGRIGRFAVPSAIAAGHDVVALVRRATVGIWADHR